MRCLLSVVMLAGVVSAQTETDYSRANSLRQKMQGLALNVTGPMNWIGGTDRFWYRKSVAGGNVFIVMNAATMQKSAAFDHDKLAAALGEKYTGLTLPFSEFTFTDEGAIQFVIAGSNWRCNLGDYSCRKTGPVVGGRGGRPPEEEAAAEYENDVEDGMVSPQQGARAAGAETPESRVKESPDGKWEATIQNFNVFLRAKGEREAVALSWDGSEGNYYTLQSVAWSPDSRKIAAYRVRPGYKREVHYIESSPADQLQPKHSTREYAKPGDALDMARPVLFDVFTRKATVVDDELFPNPYSLSRPVWRVDSRAFTFEYNQRGHQVYRVIEVDGASGRARAVITETSATFIDYRPLVPNQRDSGKKVRYDLSDGKEIIWMSERDGWSHLYLYDGATGKVKNQITKGSWVVRSVEKVDEEKRQIFFSASGMQAGRDPYFTHYYRINFDGSGLTALTDENGNHTAAFSKDMKYYVDTWSRVDAAPISQLRRTDDQKALGEVERGDLKPLLDAGWKAPEVFSAVGRDGKTEIWGIIQWPANFDASKKYPVIESIYAGPQGSFVPKTFSALVQPLNELGFIVVQIDGMGTTNRSKAFHDVAWKNLGDAGFADRILWHKAAAAKYPAYDITRVGIFGTSAGGQNSMGALLFHPEFYKVAVSNSGCHDNRMDKIWWNEQWMGWPLGPHYGESSNVDNAKRLEGKLLLVVGEMDTNVDPASTLQVVNALIKADKKFDLLFVPGGGHGAGGAFGQRLLEDFFVHNLAGVEPPDWNRLAKESKAVGAEQ
ncbi:MAG TPA: DPP IV N-terminal domain-containing protein [Bryobacteraceae bacterium]|nr:DPP IV N-terminal domain-containing protein [Bryobacteraceae bacterium]